MTNQINFTFQDSDWVPPTSYPDLRNAKEIAIDLETKDPFIKSKGPGWPTNNGTCISCICVFIAMIALIRIISMMRKMCIMMQLVVKQLIKCSIFM